jgi:excinuclease ABC subunit A
VVAPGRLVERGNTVVVIEHNLDVIKTADGIIDLGPEGGALVAQGTPEQVAAKADTSYTGRFLAKVVKPAARRKRSGARPKVPAAA